MSAVSKTQAQRRGDVPGGKKACLNARKKEGIRISAWVQGIALGDCEPANTLEESKKEFGLAIALSASVYIARQGGTNRGRRKLVADGLTSAINKISCETVL